MKCKQRGSLTVEVALGLPVLIMVMFTWFDLSVLTYSMGVTDHALTSAVMRSKKQGNSSNSKTVDYNQEITDSLNESGGSLWSIVVERSSIVSQIYYFKNMADFVSCNKTGRPIDECSSVKIGSNNNNSIDMPLAIYQLTFTYKPLFNFVLPEMNIRREIVAVQEYERCTFKVGKGASCGN
ncbi:pilus assembly protein [Vibrio cyclitrophicus]|uniref:TadE family protein n=1 Tax=Vibrio splendidus TaxID=29497 RepID=UPI00246979AA|nr:pilus assembly protein [Vibrio splendidus]CAK2825166.1 tight adherence protein E [Vibrio crassostreae]MDH5939496.1 pilus assembly protein [Vibrio splendidus]CAK2825401.1 tight adherence protein E [Vibrio crassostreae]CAK2829970.1 tight adherence protein E [Vibrio crassostreae]CAK2831545.1 tight adherence protein E [Vibrio crassostreae]